MEREPHDSELAHMNAGHTRGMLAQSVASSNTPSIEAHGYRKRGNKRVASPRKEQARQSATIGHPHPPSLLAIDLIEANHLVHRL
jgi:hypothetical protein